MEEWSLEEDRVDRRGTLSVLLSLLQRLEGQCRSGVCRHTVQCQPVTIWMDLKGVILSEIRQEKTKPV